MNIILRKSEKTTTLADLQDRLQQVEDGGDLLLSLSTKTLDDGTDVNVAAFGQGAATPPLGALELFTEPAGMAPDREATFFRTIEADGSDFVTVSNVLIEGTPARVVVCRKSNGAVPLTGAPDDGHGSSNPHGKPPVITTFHSPNHSSRNGVKIDAIVLHCTEATLDSTLQTFMDPTPLPEGRQVSVHYVIDRNGDIYQMVADDDRANHCKGVNEHTIGIEHIGQITDEIASAQKDSSVELIRWLTEQYDIPQEQIFGHDFMPGRLTSTSCPDKLFGPVHSQATVVAWVKANVSK